MWKSHIFRGFGIFFIASLLLSSCRNDSDDNKRESLHDYDFIVKPVESDYADISRVMLYVFDTGRKLTGSQQTAFNQAVKLNYPPGQKFTVVAWGYTDAQRLPSTTPGMSMDDVLLTLDTTVFIGQTVGHSPEDLFYGQLSVDDPYVNACSEDREYTLWIKRKVASVAIITHNLQGTLQTADTNFSYVLGEVPRSISFSSQLGSDRVVHHPTVKFNVQRDYLTAPDFYTFPTATADSFRLDIYRGNRLLKSFFKDDYGTDFKLQEGKRHLIWIEYNGNNSSSSDMSVTIKVNDWNGNNISEEFK